VTSRHVHVGEGGEENLESDNYTFSFHIGLKLLAITPVFFFVLKQVWLKKILSASTMVIKTYNIQLPENLM